MSATVHDHRDIFRQDEFSSQPEPYKGYALSGKIMLSAIIVLFFFFVVVIMVCLYLYARWYLLRARRRNLRRNRHNRRTHIVFHEDQSAAAAASTCGLEESVLKTLPVFVYTSKANPEILECAVCLSEFDDNETGRLLPKCKHSFHIECIDMWFHSHSTCPLCRCAVEPGTETTENAGDLVLNVVDAECTESARSSSGLCGECSGSRTLRGTSSFGARRKPMDIAVPSRHESFGRSEAESPLGQAFRSPMNRMLSFKRILSRDRRNGGVSPSGNASCGSVAELGVERGGREGAE